MGNTLTIGGKAREYLYDTTGRMTQVKRAGAAVMNYRYNGRGEQVRRYLGTTNTYTLYDEAGHWLGDYDTNGAPKQQAIWLDDLPVGLLANGGQLHYIEPDHLGSPRVVVDAARDVAVWNWSLKGEAFGNTAPNQDPDGDGTAMVFDMRFPGQRFDVASGFNQNYFRDYDAATGRYGQSDPIGLAGGGNTYTYVSSNPMTLIDLLGLTQHDVDFLFALAKERELDLRFPGRLNVRDLGGDEVGYTNYLKRTITLDDRYLRSLSPAQRVDLYDTIVHEGLHLTKGVLYSARNHEKIYEEAGRRTESAKDQIEMGSYDCNE
ncbi:RHS repeat-associated protein [Xanthomonas campestris]|nr:RHS repeat-associated protein [Xanthomonas sp. 3075]